jgi:formate C-acetyltransferase
MIELFVDQNTPNEIWEKAFESIRTSNGQPAFYNPQVLLGGLQKKFKNIRDEDIEKFCGGGCTEAMLAGLSNVGSLDAGINLLLILEKCIKTELVIAKDFDDFYTKYINAVKEVVDTVTTEIGNSQTERAKHNPLPMRTLLIDDCIDNGLDYNNGGARYKWSIINFAGMINVIDAMLVIRDYIFGNNIQLHLNNNSKP